MTIATNHNRPAELHARLVAEAMGLFRMHYPQKAAHVAGDRSYVNGNVVHIVQTDGQLAATVDVSGVEIVPSTLRLADPIPTK